MSFENLPHVHAARNAKRVQNDIHWCAIGKIGHVFLGNNFGDNAFVSVATGHLIAHAELAFAGDVDLDLLDDAWIDIVAALDAPEV